MLPLAGLAALLLMEFLWGFVSTFTRWLQADIAPAPMLFYRLAFSAALLLLAALLFRERMFPAKRKLGQAAIAGFFYAVTLLLFILGVENTTIANTVLLQQLAPVYVVLISFFVLGKGVSRTFLASLFLGIAGSAIILQADLGSIATATNSFGNIVALLSGVTFAAYMVISGYLGPRFASSTQLSLWVAVFGVLMLLWAPFSGVNTLSPTGWLMLAVLGAVLTGLPLLLFNFALKKMQAPVVSLLLLLLPLFHSSYAYVFLGEVPNTWTFVGGALTVAAVALVIREKKVYKTVSAA